MFANLLLVAALGLVRYDQDQQDQHPTPAERPETVIWIWSDGRSVVATVGPSDRQWESRPGWWVWQLWSGWVWHVDSEVDLIDTLSVREAWERAWRRARVFVPPEPWPWEQP